MGGVRGGILARVNARDRAAVWRLFMGQGRAGGDQVN